MAYPIEAGIQISLDNTTWYKLTDHNRSPIQANPQLIEKSARMANGTMRKYVVAKKMTINASWNKIPSQSEYTVDKNKSSEWLEAFYNANVGMPVYVKIVNVSGVTPSTGSAPTDGTIIESETYQCFITNFSTTTIWRTRELGDWDNNQSTPVTWRRRDFVDMEIEFTEI